MKATVFNPRTDDVSAGDVKFRTFDEVAIRHPADTNGPAEEVVYQRDRVTGTWHADGDGSEPVALLTTPVVHLNGSGKTRLLEQQDAVLEHLDKALDALREAAPNQRDYYPLDPNGEERVFPQVREEYRSRELRLRAIMNEVRGIRRAVEEQS